MKKTLFQCLLLPACLGFSLLPAQSAKDWNVADSHGPSRVVNFTTTEGTWMNVDLSPDGKEIAFDLLGDIYVMPVTGGKARCIAQGLPFETQPRYSPDGSHILFTSDRGGGDNLWVMKRDGSDAKAVTSEKFRLLNNGFWSPDGEYIIGRKHYTGTRSLGAGEMWLYHRTGGDGMKLTARKNDQQDAGEPVFSHDGRYVYFSEDVSPGPFFQYNKDPHGQIYVIKRYDRQTGEIKTVVSGPGGAVRPMPSPDGKYLAFVRRIRMNSVLFLQDLKTGEEWPVWDQLSKDQQETWATFGVYPNYDWMPDSKTLVIWAHGKIWKLDTQTGKADNIPFEADVKQTITDAVLFRQEVAPAQFEAKMIRHLVTAPDGKKVVFNAAGHLYVKDMPAGTPKRLSGAAELEYEPSFSADGKKLVYTVWTDAGMGAVKVWDLASGKSTAVTSEKGYYHSPRFSPDGKWIVYRKGGGSTELGYAYDLETGLYLIPAAGGEAHLLTEDGEYPSFTADGKGILYFEDGEPKALKRLDLEKRTVQTLATSQYATSIVPSPDGKWVAFTELWKVYVAAFPQAGKPVDLSAGMGSVPVYQVTRDAGTCLHWSGDSKSLHWILGPEYFSRKLTDCFTFIPGAPDSLPAWDTTGTRLGLTLPTDVPKGLLAFTHARIITLKGDEVIEDGTILVEDNKIKAVGAFGSVQVPAQAKVTDCQGKTIMPGLVDVHAHLGNSYNGISPQQQWSYFTSLAYGVTTTHDPSSNTEMVFSQSEMVKAGVMVGPRIYSTGTILYGAEGDFKAVINSLDDARAHLRRLKAVGAFSVKSYNQPRRNQRQMVIQAARELNMMVYPEGGSFFYHNLSMILDGHTGIEHSIPVSPLYKDVISLWSASKTGYTPTLIVSYGGIWGENYWYQKTDVWRNEKLLKFYPQALIDSRSMRRMYVPDEDFGHIGNAQAVKAVADGGTKVQLGAHGQLHGLGAHWELWMFVQGGMSPLQAIRAGTQWGADYIGMGDQIGSLEPGKLADFIVLDKNPLEDIRNSESVLYTVMNGRMYDAATLHEVGNYDRKRLPFWWENGRGPGHFPFHQETGSYMGGHCGCYQMH